MVVVISDYGCRTNILMAGFDCAGARWKATVRGLAEVLRSGTARKKESSCKRSIEVSSCMTVDTVSRSMCISLEGVYGLFENV